MKTYKLLKGNIVWNIIYKLFIQTHFYWKMSPLPPLHWLLLLAPIKLIWEMFSLKRSHFFTWLKGTLKKIDIIKNPLLLVSNDPLLEPNPSSLQAFIGLNWTWRKTTILKPLNYQGEYQIGFIRWDNVLVFCTVIIPNGSIAVIQGPNANKFFAFSYSKDKSQRKPIKLKKVAENIDKWALDNVALL